LGFTPLAPRAHTFYTTGFISQSQELKTHEILTEILFHHCLLIKELWGLFIGLTKIQF